MNQSTHVGTATTQVRVLDINGRSFVPLDHPVEGTIDGFYKQEPNGILLFDVARAPFVFVVANARQGYFFVSCSRHGKVIRYMHSTTSSDEKRLGLDTLGYAAERALAESLPQQLNGTQPNLQTLEDPTAADALPTGWTEARPGGLATNVDPQNGGIIDQTCLTNEWFVVFHRDGLEPLEGFATRGAAFAAFHSALGQLPTA